MKICPKCGNKKFEFTRFVESSSVSVDFDEEGKIKIVYNDDDSSTSKEVLQCPSCGTNYDLSNPDVINAFKNQLVQCKCCGNKVSEQELNSEGICTVCIVKKEDPTFGNVLNNMSDFNMARILASLKIENLTLSSENQNLKTKLAEAEKLEEKMNATEEPKKKRGRRKKNPDTESESTVEEEATDTENESEDDNIVESIDIDENVEENDSDLAINDLTETDEFMNPPEE